MGEIHKLRVKSSYELVKIVDIKIKNKPNSHGYLYLKCLIDENINFESTIKASSEDQIIVYEELKDMEDQNSININAGNERNSKILFNGIVQNIKTTNTNGLYYLEIQALTSSIKLDIEKKSRSFQNVDMTYNDLINNMMSSYSGYSFTQYADKEGKIAKPLFQYKETDWDFLKRIASELNLDLYCDIMNLNNMFNFGIPNNNSYELNDNIDYDVFKDLKSFQEAGGYNSGYDDTDYFYYEVKIRNIFEIGSEISYKQKSLYVREYEAYKDKEEIFYKYKLCREKGVWQSVIYNDLLKGVTLEGEVLAVQNEQVKLQLSIDESQDEGTAYWFDYAPPSVNIMYSMPLVGESVRLYFPKESSEDSIVIGCIRKNGDTCEGISDPANRYFHTESGNEIAMLPGAVNITSGGLSINLEDETGVTFTSPNGLNLNAGGDVIIRTPNNVNIGAQSQILMTKGNTENGVSIEGEFHIKGNKVITTGSSRRNYAPLTEDDDDDIFDTGNNTVSWSQSDVYGTVDSDDSDAQTGWIQNDDGTWNYFNPDGSMVTGWMQDDNGYWYYFDSDGEMQTGGQTINKVRYYFDSKGIWQSDITTDLLGPTPKEAAEIADNVYFENYDDVEGNVLSGDGGGWILTDHYTPDETSLQIGVYSRTWSDGQTEYVLAYRGSRLPTEHLEDWVDNLDECMGDSKDVSNGILYADYFVSNHPDAHITFVGHSKGGPEAIAAAVVEKKDAIVFNPAAPHLTDMGIDISNYSGKITAYVVEGEVLNTWQGTDELNNLNANIIFLPQQDYDYTKEDIIDEIANHSMQSVKNALRQYLESKGDYN